MKKPMVKRVPTKEIDVTTIRLDDATLAALDKHAKAAAGRPSRPVMADFRKSLPNGSRLKATK